jgi:hypothetical protein
MKKDLEAAFAHPKMAYSESEDFVHHSQAGMTLRDYFAAQALPTMLEQMFRNEPSDEAIISAISSCYGLMADAYDENEESMSDIEQGSPEWFKQRCGKATASRISDIVAKTKTGYSTSRANYMAQLVVERMTNQVAESYSNAAMEWGVEQEIYARAAYELKTGNMVNQVGAIDHPTALPCLPPLLMAWWVMMDA